MSGVITTKADHRPSKGRKAGHEPGGKQTPDADFPFVFGLSSVMKTLSEA
jgi:hypothetical protein